ncbi:hypothetical protein SDC9_130583 [bioreactor metagenome]|uniref:Uncharacterized protein n=1 Tax=bioreactor metagenome TaxID=1076179 RepID=A0A645D2U0_9ZZZZ
MLHQKISSLRIGFKDKHAAGCYRGHNHLFGSKQSQRTTFCGWQHLGMSYLIDESNNGVGISDGCVQVTNSFIRKRIIGQCFFQWFSYEFNRCAHVLHHIGKRLKLFFRSL